MKKPPIKVICPYCDKPAKLVDSKAIYGPLSRDYGNFYQCVPCGAYVGVHKNSARNVPLGRLANKELRNWKMKAHKAFDPLWKKQGMSRGDAYKLMMDKLGITSEEAHIGKFDLDQCKRLVEIFSGLSA